MLAAVRELVDTKFKRISVGSTVILFILLFLLFFLYSWKLPDPMPEVEPRIEIIPVEMMDQGASGEKGGADHETPFEQPASENTEPTKSTADPIKVTTQTTSTATVASGTNTTNTQEVNNNALFHKPTGDGKDGKEGDETGPGKNEVGKEGPGPGEGTVGAGYSLSGRSALDKPAPKNVTLKAGKIVIMIWVDQSGKVIRTKANYDLSTIVDSKLIAECEKAAMKTVWSENEDAEEEQKGSITYNFKLN